MAAQKGGKKTTAVRRRRERKNIERGALISSPPLIIQLLPLQTFKAMQFLGPALVN